MVTPDTTSSLVEDQASDNQVEASTPEVGDEPLIPTDFEDRYEAPESETEAGAENQEQSGAENNTENGAVEPTEETTPSAEENIESEVTEPVAETQQTQETVETAASEPEVSTERTYSQNEVSKIESAKDTQINDLQKQISEMNQQVQQLSQTYSDNVLEAEVRGYAQSIQSQLENEGYDQAAAERIATQQANAAKTAFIAEQQTQALQQQNMQLQQQNEETARRTSVDHLMQQHGLSSDQHRNLLMGYTDPALAVQAAETLGEAEKLKQESIQARQAQVPAGGESNSYDAGTGANGSETDAQWLQRYNAGIYDSPADDERAMKLLAGQGLRLPYS
jgi:hypothetical protein